MSHNGQNGRDRSPSPFEAQINSYLEEGARSSPRQPRYAGGYASTPIPVPPPAQPAASAPRLATDAHSRLDRQLEVMENLIGAVNGLGAKLDAMGRNVNTRMSQIEARIARIEDELGRQQGDNPSAQPSDPSQAGPAAAASTHSQFLP